MHGTESGYNRHIRNQEPACQECKAAHAEYARERRANNPAARRKAKARNTADAVLRAKYQNEWLAEQADALTRLGDK